MTSRPVLGVIACTRVQPEAEQFVSLRYLEAPLVHANVAALLVPSLPDLIAAADLVGRLDGLLLTGSPSNVQPARYGEDIAGDGPFDPARDTMSQQMIAAMLAAGKPVFGICRGFQEINVAFGGTLRRDVSRPDAVLAHHADSAADVPTMFGHLHPVTIAPGGVMAQIYGDRTLRVNSVHYQGVGRLGAGLRTEAVAPDGLVEAVSADVAGARVLAVQWHPEWDTAANPDSLALFRAMGRCLRTGAFA